MSASPTANANPNAAVGQHVHILITGLPRCGKSSIKRVVFHSEMVGGREASSAGSDGTPSTLSALNGLLQLQIKTYGGRDRGQFEFEKVQSIIFVIDLTDDYLMGMAEFYRLVEHIHRGTSNDPRFHVFLHKCDGLSIKARQEIKQEICRQVSEELAEVNVQFHLTSLYDCSILHAISQVVQRHLKASLALRGELDTFCTGQGFERAILFDGVSKIALASDSSPYDESVYEMCCEASDVIEDVASIYSDTQQTHGKVMAEICLESAAGEVNLVHFNIVGRKGLALLLVRAPTNALPIEKKLIQSLSDRIEANM